MNRFLCHLSFALLGLFCAGCVPVQVASSPSATGIVLDRQTREPLAGAQVIVSRSWLPDLPDKERSALDQVLTNSRPPLVITGIDGRFSIPAETRWKVKFSPPNPSVMGTLVIRRDGYQPALLPLVEGLEIDGGAIFLTPNTTAPAR